MSYWDAYQKLKTVLKPDRMDIPQVLPQSLALFECLTEQIKNRIKKNGASNTWMRR